MLQTFSWQGIEGPWKFTQPLALSAVPGCGVAWCWALLCLATTDSRMDSISFHRDFSRDIIPGWSLPGWKNVSMYVFNRGSKHLLQNGIFGWAQFDVTDCDGFSLLKNRKNPIFPVCLYRTIGHRIPILHDFCWFQKQNPGAFTLFTFPKFTSHQCQDFPINSIFRVFHRVFQPFSQYRRIIPCKLTEMWKAHDLYISSKEVSPWLYSTLWFMFIDNR